VCIELDDVTAADRLCLMARSSGHVAGAAGYGLGCKMLRPEPLPWSDSPSSPPDRDRAAATVRAIAFLLAVGRWALSQWRRRNGPDPERSARVIAFAPNELPAGVEPARRLWRGCAR
jgi:hypothetical protein